MIQQWRGEEGGGKHNPPPVTQEYEVRQPHKNTQQSWWTGCLHFLLLFWGFVFTCIHSTYI